MNESFKKDLNKIRVSFKRLRDKITVLLDKIESNPELIDEVTVQVERLEIDMMEQQSKLELMGSLLNLHPPKDEEEE